MFCWRSSYEAFLLMRGWHTTLLAITSCRVQGFEFNQTEAVVTSRSLNLEAIPKFGPADICERWTLDMSQALENYYGLLLIMYIYVLVRYSYRISHYILTMSSTAFSTKSNILHRLLWRNIAIVLTILRRWNADDFPRNGEPWRRCGREQSRRRRTRGGTRASGWWMYCWWDQFPFSVWRRLDMMVTRIYFGDSVFWSRDRKFEKRHDSYRFLHHLFFVQLVYVMFYLWKMVANR